MQRARRTPVAGRGLLALVTSAVLALGFLVVPAAASAASAATAAPAPAARSHRPASAFTLACRSTSASPMSAQAARSSAEAGQRDALQPAGPRPLHVAATPSTPVGLDVRAPRAAPAEHRADAFAARPALTTSSRAPPTGPLTQLPVRPAAL